MMVLVQVPRIFFSQLQKFSEPICSSSDYKCTDQDFSSILYSSGYNSFIKYFFFQIR